MLFPSFNSAQPETLSSRLCFLLVAAPPCLLAPGSVAGGSYDVTGQLGGCAGLAWSRGRGAGLSHLFWILSEVQAGGNIYKIY